MIIEKLDEQFYYHFFNGTLNNAYDYFGAHIKKRDEEIIGCEFLIYAPNANKVCLIGEFNNFIDLELREIKHGFYYIYINHNMLGMSYKYKIYTNNEILYKSDPFAFYSEFRPNTNSIIYDITNYYHKSYKKENFNDKAIVIYEMHFGSWKQRFAKYNQMVDELIIYLKEHKYTHLELLPIHEHPLDESWGYMTTGYYSITSRYGTPNDFMYLINKLHENNIYIILDWVLGHICKDDFGLYRFDGTYLYEYESSDIRENYDWGTANLDFNKGITKSFMLSNAMFFIKYYKVDGFRIDAVRNLIYYLGDETRVNYSAVNFIKQLNNEIKKEGAIVIAEDSSNYLNVTKEYGLGFNYKWNMGWMNDSLKYFELDPLYRSYHHNLITFSFTYAFNENYILPISHDEVVHLKKSLYSKMFGDYFDKFSTLRVFLGYMFTHPGKKLLFMGQEFGVKDEWNVNSTLSFDLLNDTHNKKLNIYFKDLVELYINETSLHKDDLNSFLFIEPDNNKQSIFVYSRINNEHLIIIMNCLPISYYNYKIGVFSDNYKEILNSDNDKYGGNNLLNNHINVYKEKYQKQDYTLELNLPPLSIIILKKI